MVLYDFDQPGSSSRRTHAMDTPEAEISAIQSGRAQPLPTYTEHDDSRFRPLISTVDLADTRHIPPTYAEQQSEPKVTLSDEVEEGESSHNPSAHPESFPLFDEDILISESNREEEDVLAKEKRDVISGFFEAIEKEQGEVIDLFLGRNLVTANTTDEHGKTPLLAAVNTKNVKVVQQLLDAGAEPDAFGVASKEFNSHTRNYDEQYVYSHRTPLMLASSIGHLPLVKLFHERYACNDALVAPDGQIALRLASSGGHREVVDYLPSRRAGGFLRWKTAHRRSLARARRALHQMYKFVKFFVWDIEKFFLWTCPKHMVVLPLKKGCEYCWTNKKRFADWCVCEIKKGPERAKRAAQACGRGLAKIPKLTAEAGKACGRGLGKIPKITAQAGKACWRGLKKIPPATVKVAKWTKELVVEVAKECWKILTVDLPRITKKVGKWIFSLLFVRLPKAMLISAKWLWEGIVTIVLSLWNVLTRIVSAIHTFITSLSLKDILNGIKHVLEAIFVTFPKMMWKWIEAFGQMSFDALKALFGCLGECIWWVITGLGYLAVYLPRKLWAVIQAMGESVGKGMHEILIWFRPKA